MEGVCSTVVIEGRDVGKEMRDGADDGGWELAVFVVRSPPSDAAEKV